MVRVPSLLLTCRFALLLVGKSGAMQSPRLSPFTAPRQRTPRAAPVWPPASGARLGGEAEQ